MPNDFTNSDPVERIGSYAIEDLDFMLLYEQVESSKFEVLWQSIMMAETVKSEVQFLGFVFRLIIQSWCGSLIIHATFVTKNNETVLVTVWLLLIIYPFIQYWLGTGTIKSPKLNVLL